MPIYRGISFPFRRGRGGFPVPATDDELLWSSIRTLILTGPGERVMRPDVGSQVMGFLFENNDNLLGQLVAQDVSLLLTRYEPRILLTEVRVASIDRDKGELVIALTYINRSTGVTSDGTVSLPGTSESSSP